MKRVEEKVISEEEGKEYMHIVKTRTDELIRLKTLPKKIVNTSEKIENKNILSEFEGFKTLEGGQ